MGLVLVGTVESSYRVLETLVDLKAPIKAVLSLSPEDAVGVSDYADLRSLAQENGIVHRYIKQVNSPSVVQYLADLNPDVILVIGWSQLVRREVMACARFGCIGAHPALLPRNRGRAVIPWVLINNEPATGMTLFHIDEGTDSGDIIGQAVLPISDTDTAQTLYHRAVDALCDLLRTHLPAILTNSAPRQKQDDAQASYCAKRTRADGLIDWQATTRSIFNLVRAVGRPYPGAFTYYGEKNVTVWAARPGDEEWVATPGQVLRVDSDRGVLVKTGDGSIWLTQLEVDGGAIAPSEVFKRVGEKFGALEPARLLERICELEARIAKLEGKP